MTTLKTPEINHKYEGMELLTILPMTMTKFFFFSLKKHDEIEYLTYDRVGVKLKIIN